MRRRLMQEKLLGKTASLEELVLPTRISQLLSPMLRGDEMPQNMTFYGIPGSGKTSCASLIAEAVGDVLWVDASAEGRMETVNGVVRDYTKYPPRNGARCKVVILEEADGLNRWAQQALKRVIEQTEEHIVWLLTTNHIERIQTALLSRCTPIRFGVIPGIDNADELRQQLVSNIEVKLGEKLWQSLDRQQIKKLIAIHYPDVRSVLRTLQLLLIQKHAISASINE